MVIVVDLGCGTRRHSEDCIGIDKFDFSKYHPKGKFIKCDIEKDLFPFTDNTVDEVFCSQVLEHCHDIIHPMEEIHRICKHDANVHIDVPHETSIWKWGDPTHVRSFNENTFLFFCKGLIQHGSDYKIETDFDILSMGILANSRFLFVNMKVVKPIRWDLHKPKKDFISKESS